MLAYDKLRIDCGVIRLHAIRLMCCVVVYGVMDSFRFSGLVGWLGIVLSYTRNNFFHHPPKIPKILKIWPHIKLCAALSRENRVRARVNLSVLVAGLENRRIYKDIYVFFNR